MQDVPPSDTDADTLPEGGDSGADTTPEEGQTSPVASEDAGPDILAQAQTLGGDAWVWLQTHVLTTENLIAIGVQMAVIIAAILVGRALAPRVRSVIDMGLTRLPEPIHGRVNEFAPLLLDPGLKPALWIGCLWIGQTILAGMGQPSILVRIAASLATAWLIIRLVTQFLPKDLRKPVSIIAWGAALLNAMGVLDDVVRFINTIGPDYAGRKINAAFLIQAILTAALFLYGAHWLSKRLKSRVETLPRVEPSLRILMSNAIQIGLFIAAALLTLTGLGIPLTGLAVLGGAIGVGLGFGMQQIVANFISGVILLTDRSIKPNDVIEVDDTYGVVKSLGLRYASVITRDGKEHLIPNEMLITDKVINWSYSDNEVRIKRRFIVEYETDLRLAVRLCIEAAKEFDRVLKSPEPKCLVMEFGDEAVVMEARFWIDDPQNGVNNIGSDVMLAMWDKFKENGIDAPLQQEEIKITGDSFLQVRMVKDDPEPKAPAPSNPASDKVS